MVIKPPTTYPANIIADRVWDNVRLPFAKRLEEKARYANDFDGSDLGSIDFDGGGIDRCLDSIAEGTLRERVVVGSILHGRGSANES